MTELLVPLARLRSRLDDDRQNSDAAAWFSLLLYSEFVAKLAVLSVIAAIEDDRERHRYRLLHKLVRADGIGDWATALDEALTGPSSHFLGAIRPEVAEVTRKESAGYWQCDAVLQISQVLEFLEVEDLKPQGKQALRSWFHYLAKLRNKTRAHGATTAAKLSFAFTPLFESTRLVAENFSLFQRPWCFLHRNLSGKYRITRLGGDTEPFEFLKSENQHAFENGVYYWASRPIRVPLVSSDPDGLDFFVANGSFGQNTFEMLSYTSDSRRLESVAGYLEPIEPLPRSETEGVEELKLAGHCLSNIPPAPTEYISRPELENQLLEQLALERHPIVTLAGPGGIGKTSLALRVLERTMLAPDCRFHLALWFSARDIDLLPQGPKRVQPSGVRLADFAKEYCRLMASAGEATPDRPEEALSQGLSSERPAATLFVFDNFETVAHPHELYRWLDSFVRSPNKVLITTRIREFRGDFDLPVSGMREAEALALIGAVTDRLGIADLLSRSYKDELVRESAGHPYVIKMLLGECAKEGMAVSPRRVIAAHDELLTALFERSYERLSPGAQRLFLLLCSWRSVVPSLALELAVIRSATERFDTRAALEELQRSSLCETYKEGDLEYVGVPLATLLFGKRKLSASALRPVVEADAELLRAFGVAGPQDLRHGFERRVHSFLRYLEGEIASGKSSVADVRPLVEFVGRRVPRSFLAIAEFFAEMATPESLDSARWSLRSFIETSASSDDRVLAWSRLATLSQLAGDRGGELHSLVELAKIQETPLREVSNAANRVNGLLRDDRARGSQTFDVEARKLLLTELAGAMERRMDSLDATDLSRLAWLYLNMGNHQRAEVRAEEGLRRETENFYCLSILKRLRS